MVSGGNPIVLIIVGLSMLRCADESSDSENQGQAGGGEGTAGAGGAGGTPVGGSGGEGGVGAAGSGGFGGTPVDEDLGAGGRDGGVKDFGVGHDGASLDMNVGDAIADVGPQIVDAFIRPDLGPPPECDLSAEDDPDHDCVRSAEDNCPHIRNEDTQNDHRDFDRDGLDDVCGDVDRAGVHDRFADFSDPQLLCEIRDLNLASAEALDVLVRCRDGNGQVVRNALFSIPTASDVHFLAPQPDPSGEHEQLSTKGPVRVSVINDQPELLQNGGALFELDHILESGAQSVLLSASAHVLRTGERLADLRQVTRPRREGEQGAISDIAFPSIGGFGGAANHDNAVLVNFEHVADLVSGGPGGAAVFALNRPGNPIMSALPVGAFFGNPFSMALNAEIRVDFSGDHDLRGLIWAAGASPEVAALFAQSEPPERDGAIVRYMDTEVEANHNRFTDIVSLGTASLVGEGHELFYALAANGQLSLFDPATVNGAQEPVLTLTDQRLANARDIALRRGVDGVIYGAASVPAQNAEADLGKIILFEISADGQHNVREVVGGWNPGTLEIDENLNVYLAVEQNVWQRQPEQLNGNAAHLVVLRWDLQDAQ